MYKPRILAWKRKHEETDEISGGVHDTTTIQFMMTSLDLERKRFALVYILYIY